MSKENEAMEALQPRLNSAPQTPVSHSTQPVSGGTIQASPSEGSEHNREDALTIKFAIGKVNDYLQWFLMVLEALLAIRFLLKLLGADPASLFAYFVFTLTDVLLIPFTGIVPSPSIHSNQSVEIPTLIAALIYFLVFYALKRFMRILISNPKEEE